MEDQHNRYLEEFEEWITELEEGNLHENLPPTHQNVEPLDLEEWISELQEGNLHENLPPTPTPTYQNVEPENNQNDVGWENWNIEELLQGLGSAEQKRDEAEGPAAIDYLEFEKEVIKNELLEKEQLPAAYYMIVKELDGGFVLFDESEVLKLITSLEQFFILEDYSTTVPFLVKIEPHFVEKAKYQIGGQWKQYVNKYALKDGDKIEFSVSNLGLSTITARRM